MISTEIFVFILAVLIAIVSTLCIALLGVVKRKGNGTKNGSTGEPAGKPYNDDAGQILNEPEAYTENHSEIHTPLQGAPQKRLSVISRFHCRCQKTGSLLFWSTLQKGDLLTTWTKLSADFSGTVGLVLGAYREA